MKTLTSAISHIPVHVSPKGINLSVVAQNTHRLSTIPAGKCIGREPRVDLKINKNIKPSIISH